VIATGAMSEEQSVAALISYIDKHFAVDKS